MALLPTSEMRARRFPVQLAVQYREQGAGKWYAGTTDNISLSGILFRGQHRFQPMTQVEVSFELPKALSGPAPVSVVSSGYVVRDVPPMLGLGNTRLAVAFAQFRIDRPQPVVVRRLHGGEIVRHRVNSLLAVILGTSELLLETPQLSADLRTGLARIRESAMALGATTREIFE